MDLRILRYFLVVAREENMTKAAKLLHITQPTLSRQMMQLETTYGVKLFRRSNHSIILTPPGLLLRRRAQEMVSLADKTATELQTPDDKIAGEISIGCGETKNVDAVAQLMKAFRKLYPDVYFSVYTGIADDVKERLEKGLLDMGLLIEPVDIGKYHFLPMPYRDEWVALMPADHPLANHPSLRPADLVGHDLIFALRPAVKEQLTRWFGPYIDEITVSTYMNLSAYNKHILVQEGLGIALGLAFASTYPKLRQIPLEPPITNGSFLVWKKQEFLTPAMIKFIEFSKTFTFAPLVEA